MSTNLKQIAEDVKALNRMFASVRSLAEFVEDVAKIDQLEREATARKEKALKDADKADNQLGELVLRLDAAKVTLAAAQTEAESKIARAEKDAQSIVAQAAVEADSIKAEAKAQAAEVKAKVNKAEKELAELEKRKEAEAAALADIQAKIEKAKASILGAG